MKLVEDEAVNRSRFNATTDLKRCMMSSRLDPLLREIQIQERWVMAGQCGDLWMDTGHVYFSEHSTSRFSSARKACEGQACLLSLAGAASRNECFLPQVAPGNLSTTYLLAIHLDHVSLSDWLRPQDEQDGEDHDLRIAAITSGSPEGVEQRLPAGPKALQKSHPSQNRAGPITKCVLEAQMWPRSHHPLPRVELSQGSLLRCDLHLQFCQLRLASEIDPASRHRPEKNS